MGITQQAACFPIFEQMSLKSGMPSGVDEAGEKSYLSV